MSDPDAILVERCKKGDNNSFELLVLKYQQSIFNLIFHMTESYEDVEDLAQEVFIKAYRAIGSFKGDSAFYTWLYRIAVNTCINFIRSRGRRARYETDPDTLVSGIDGFPSTQDDPTKNLESKEILQEMERAFSSLEPEFRSAILLRELEGMSYEDIAEALDCPPGTVRSRIFRARAHLKEKLKGRIT